MKSSNSRRMTADDLYRFELISDPQISPDGRHAIYAVQWVERDTEKKYCNLWLVPTDGGEARRFTVGKQRDTRPRWSPDGTKIAFLSNRQDEKQAQIYLLPFHGGEAQPLTDMKGDFGAFYWSPDGSQFLCQFRKKDADALEREEDEQKKKLGIVARTITHVGFRSDGAGYLSEERWHIWTVDAGSGEPTQLTSGEYDEVDPAWSPDGNDIFFLSNRSEEPYLNYEFVDLFVIPAGGGEARKIETPVGTKYALSVSPTREHVAYVGTEGRGDWWRNNSLWIVPADGSAPAVNLSASHDLHVANSTLGDVADRPFTTPQWSPDGSHLYFQVSRHGNTHLMRIGLDGQLEAVLAPDGVISDFSLDARGERLAYLWGHFKTPGQVWVWRAADGESEQLTSVNDWLRKIDLGTVEEIWTRGDDGYDLHGWILQPPNFDPDRKYPSILEIHGGPWLQYGRLFMHEFYWLAANDFVVYFMNPRGGHGYGEPHGRAIHGNWGKVDYADLMSWVDYVEAQPYIDPRRMGVTGGSYGGYMTLWMVTHTDRFQAAVAQRVVSNMISFWGSSDVGYLFENPWGDDKPPWQNLDRYWAQSPMKYIENVTTPTLLIHSENDMRCNLEQATQVFYALKELGVPTELILFPEESHGLSRGGRTDRRVVRLNHMLRWFKEYLGDENTQD